MNSLKKAFTLMEVMICIIIIAIISSLTIITAKPSDKYNNLLYKKAYDALSLANYNIVLNLGASPYPTTAPDLCTALTSWINTQITNCSTKTVSITGNDADFVEVDSVSDSNIQFIATNDMKFYIAEFSDGSVSKNVTNTATNGVPYNFNAMVVVVDINGDKRPNTAVYTGKNMPDLVAFALLDNNGKGEVIPLGPPETDLRYMTPRVLYSDGVKLSAPTSYYNAKCKAWGPDSNGSELKSIDLYTPLSITGNFARPSTVGACTVDSTHCTANTATTTSNCKVISNNYYNN